MNPKKIHRRKGPEAALEERFEAFMRNKEWYVKKMHGSQFQAGFPDYFCSHRVYGIRLIELKHKDRKGDVFTAAQHLEFPLMSANGAQIWVMVEASEKEYEKLFRRENWYQYLGV